MHLNGFSSMEIVSVTFHSRYNRRGGENKDGLNLRRIENSFVDNTPRAGLGYNAEGDWILISHVNC